MIKKMADLLTGADPVAAAEAELERLAAHGAKLLATAETDEREAEEAEDADKLMAAAARARAARNKLRKVDAQITEARHRLELARSDARRALLERLRGAYAKAAREYLVAAAAANNCFNELVATREAFGEHAFRAEQAAVPVPPNVGGMGVISFDPLEAFAAEIGRTGFDSEFKLPRRPVDRRLRLTTGARVVGPQGPQRVDHVPQVAPAPVARPTRAPISESAATGETRMVALRGGMEHPRVGQLRTGDIVSASKAESIEMLATGAYDLAPPETVPANASEGSEA